jgi:hypothetical protein
MNITRGFPRWELKVFDYNLSHVASLTVLLPTASGKSALDIDPITLIEILLYHLSPFAPNYYAVVIGRFFVCTITVFIPVASSY